jgi:hypothetical protein
MERAALSVFRTSSAGYAECRSKLGEAREKIKAANAFNAKAAADEFAVWALATLDAMRLEQTGELKIIDSRLSELERRAGILTHSEAG